MQVLSSRKFIDLPRLKPELVFVPAKPRRIVRHLFHQTFYKSDKQRMWLVRPALELGMKLHTDIKLPVGELKSFNKFSVRSESAKYRTMTLESFPVIVVELPAMTVSFAYFLFSIAPLHQRARSHCTRICSQSHGPAFDHMLLIGHKIDHGMPGLRVKLA